MIYAVKYLRPPPIPTSSHTKHDIPNRRRRHRLQKPPLVIRQASSSPQPFELFHHLPLNLQLQRPRDGFGFVRALQGRDRFDYVDQVDHVARVAVVQSAQFFVVGGQVVDEAEVVADEGEVAGEARVRDGGAGFDAEFGGGDDEAMNPRTRGLSESAVKGRETRSQRYSRCTDVLAPELEVFVNTLESSIWTDAAETLA